MPDFNPSAAGLPQLQSPTPIVPLANQQMADQAMTQARQVASATALQEAQNKQRQFQISMLNGVMSLPEEQQVDALSRVVPMMNRMGPVQFDEKMTPATAKLYLMSNVPTEQVPAFALNQQMANVAKTVQQRLSGNAAQTGQQPPPVNGTPMPQNGIINGGGAAPIPQGGGQVIDPQTLALMATLPGYDKAAQTINEIQNQSPAGQAAIEQAKEGGKNQAANIQGANVATQTLGNLEQNLDALSTLNKDLPNPDILPVGVKAEFNKRNPFTSDKAASNSYEQFQEINQQQVLNGLSELVKSGAIRGNQFVEKILARGYAINPDATPEARQAEIDNLRAELRNITTRQQNVAGSNQSYKPIPVTTSQGKQQGTPMPQNGKITPNLIPNQTIYKGHLYIGGDPSKPESWQAQGGK